MGANQPGRLYNVPVSEKKDGETAILRNPNFTGGLVFEPAPGITQLQELVVFGHKNYPNNELFGTKNKETNEYKYITYDQAFNKAKALASGLEKLQFVKEIKEYKDYSLKMIGIYSKNREEWALADMANALYGYTMIPFYDTLGPESISYVLAHTKITSCYCSSESILTLSKTKDLHSLTEIISFDPIPPLVQDVLLQRGVHIHLFQDVIAKGAENILELPKVTSEHIFTFSYTSGTTGDPKGAMLSHRNILSAVANHHSTEIAFTGDDVYLSYLPLPHILERFISVSAWFRGTKVAFYSGDILKLKDDIAAARPTIFVSVPRLLTRFYDAITSKFAEEKGIKKALIDYALKTKLENITQDASTTHFLYDKIIFSKIRAIFGGRLRYMACGSAPISNKVIDFFKAVLCIPVLEGYGQTEACGLETLQVSSDRTAGNVGGILPSMELKLQDVPEMEYYSTDKDENGNPMPRGEICVRGNSVIPGYYKDEEKTAEAIDSEKWLHSGDIGQLTAQGGLRIIDRKKNIFKLSQGEYISPEKVENIYIRARGVAEAYVHGESLYNFCVCVLVPNPQEILKIAAELKVETTDLNELCKDKSINAFYLKTVQELGKKEGLFTFEQPQRLYLEPQSLGVHGCLTTSFKLQRHHAKSHFKQVLADLYKD